MTSSSDDQSGNFTTAEQYSQALAPGHSRPLPAAGAALGAAVAATPLQPGAENLGVGIEIDYTNYRGERAVRKILPIRVFYGKTEYHPEEQWLLKALDWDRNVERDFSLNSIHRWGSPTLRPLGEVNFHANQTLSVSMIDLMEAAAHASNIEGNLTGTTNWAATVMASLLDAAGRKPGKSRRPLTGMLELKQRLWSVIRRYGKGLAFADEVEDALVNALGETDRLHQLLREARGCINTFGAETLAPQPPAVRSLLQRIDAALPPNS
jgi:hypothetical protein